MNELLELRHRELELKQELFNAKARKSTLAFTMATKSDYAASWHHAHLCKKLDLFAQRKIRRLMVFMPPRHGKSELCTKRLPAYIFGKEPDAQIISTSYSMDLAQRMNRDVQRIIDSNKYRELFPDVGLSGKNLKTPTSQSYLRNSEIFEIVNRKGLYRCAGIGGGITGMGFDFGIIDDPIKDAKEALSKTYRQNVWDWYTSTFFTRRQENSCILIIMTRWHEDDLAGRLLKLEPDMWDIVDFPAICDRLQEDDPRQLGQALWEARYPLKELEETKRSVGSKVWNALYQQRPSAEEGNIVLREWFKYYDSEPEFDRIITSWDTTFKNSDGSDYVCGTVWGIKGADRYLLNLVNKRLSFTECMKEMERVFKIYPEANAHLIEDKANGTAIIEVLKRKISGIIPINPKESKEARFHAVAPTFEAGNIYLPNPEYCRWVPGYIDQLCTFPNAKHDDMVDSSTQALNYLRRRSSDKLRKILKM